MSRLKSGVQCIAKYWMLGFSLGIRKALILLVTVLVFWGINICAPKILSESGRYYSKVGKFSTKFPDGWGLKETEKLVKKEIASVISSVPGLRVSIGVAVENLPDPIDSEKYLETTVKEMSRVLNRFREQERGKENIDNTDACWIICTYGVGEYSTKSKIYILTKDRRGYIINFAASPSRFSEYEQKLNETAESFKFEK